MAESDERYDFAKSYAKMRLKEERDSRSKEAWYESRYKGMMFGNINNDSIDNRNYKNFKNEWDYANKLLLSYMSAIPLTAADMYINKFNKSQSNKNDVALEIAEQLIQNEADDYFENFDIAPFKKERPYIDATEWFWLQEPGSFLRDVIDKIKRNINLKRKVTLKRKRPILTREDIWKSEDLHIPIDYMLNAAQKINNSNPYDAAMKHYLNGDGYVEMNPRYYKWNSDSTLMYYPKYLDEGLRLYDHYKQKETEQDLNPVQDNTNPPPIQLSPTLRWKNGGLIKRRKI